MNTCPHVAARPRDRPTGRACRAGISSPMSHSPYCIFLWASANLMVHKKSEGGFVTRILLVAVWVVFIAAPALAQPGGLPAVNAQIDALQAQISNLRTATSILQRQINNITPAIADDGTAQALPGTCARSANSVHFRRAVTSTSPGLDFEQFFFLFPAGPGGQPNGPAAGFTVVQPQNLQPMTVQVNPEMWLASGDASVPATFTVTRDGMHLGGNGTGSPRGGPPVSLDLSRARLSKSFFLATTHLR